MIKMTTHEALCRLCKAVKKWGIYLFLDSDMDGVSFAPNEYKKAVPFLNFDGDNSDGLGVVNSDDYQCLCDGHMFVMCDSEEECHHLYNQVVGDDGPTKSNKYDGPCRVYCLTINSNGEMENENT